MTTTNASKKLKNALSGIVSDLISCSINKFTLIVSVQTESSAIKIFDLLKQTKGVYINIDMSPVFEEIDIFDDHGELVDIKVSTKINYYIVSANIAP